MPTSLVSETGLAAVPYGGRLMFTQSWEDPACDVAALHPQPGETILAITSGGDNVLGLLRTEPARIVAIDLNPAQSHLFELKRAAFLRLSHCEMLVMLGVRAGNARDLYARERAELSDEARTFWDGRLDWFDRGLLLQGGFERYYAMLRRALRVLVGRRHLERLFRLAPEEQRRFYDEEWNTWAWRMLIRIGCSRFVLGRRLDPSWFVHADVQSFGGHFARLAEHVIAELPARSNYFLSQLLLGRYADDASVPDYLKPECFDVIRARLDRVTLVKADIGDALGRLPGRSIDCFALSNVFEYSPRELFDRSLSQMIRVARPGARFSLRNLLARRRLADHPAFNVDAALSARLRDADRGFIYSHFEAATLR